VIELNEAFASQALAVLRELGIADDAERSSTPTAAPSRSAIRSACPGAPARHAVACGLGFPQAKSAVADFAIIRSEHGYTRVRCGNGWRTGPDAQEQALELSALLETSAR
jgi:hypothetical protein